MKFDDPAPNFPSYSGSLELVVEELKMNPDRWAVFTYTGGRRTKGAARQAAYEIRRGMPTPFAPAGAFEADTRVVTGETRIYVRYVGTGAQR